jgi:hypothetical protein
MKIFRKNQWKIFIGVIILCFIVQNVFNFLWYNALIDLFIIALIIIVYHLLYDENLDQKLNSLIENNAELRRSKGFWKHKYFDEKKKRKDK